MADLKCDSISAFSPRLARLVNGKSARLRARRIREHITMSLSGPVPRSHSPEVRGQVVQSSCVGILEAELVSEPRGLFVIFAGDRPRGAGTGAGAAGRRPGRCRAALPTCRVAPWTRWSRGSRPRPKTR